MPFFFDPFPTVEYDVKKNNKLELLTNVTVRFKLQEVLNNRVSILYNYSVKDGERPDVIAHKYYGDSSLDWIVLLTNGIINPHFDWPLDSATFNKFIKNKYGSRSVAAAQVHHYEKILRSQNVLFDGTIIDEKTVWVDQDTYNTLDPSERKIVYSYDFENELNEKKGQIKILDKRYVTQIVNEVDAIFQ